VLLIGGHHRHDSIASTDQGLIDERVGADRAMCDQDLIGSSGLEETGDSGAQAIAAFDFAIGEFEREDLIQEGVTFAGKREQLIDRQRGDASLAEVVATLSLKLIHPLLNGKRGDLHAQLPDLVICVT